MILIGVKVHSYTIQLQFIHVLPIRIQFMTTESGTYRLQFSPEIFRTLPCGVLGSPNLLRRHRFPEWSDRLRCLNIPRPHHSDLRHHDAHEIFYRYFWRLNKINQFIVREHLLPKFLPSGFIVLVVFGDCDYWRRIGAPSRVVVI